jgi:hypothetical protein
VSSISCPIHYKSYLAKFPSTLVYCTQVIHQVIIIDATVCQKTLAKKLMITL